MIFTPKEFSIINIVLTVNPDRQPRTFSFSDLAIAFSIHEKVMKNTEIKEDGGIFIEWESSFTSEENVFISKLLKDFKFNVVDWWVVLSLQNKLI